MKKNWHVWNNQKGLTLIEVLAVIVIIGIIAAIAVPNIANIISKSEQNADEQTETVIENAALLYLFNENPNIEDLEKDGTSSILSVQALVDNGYLDAVPKSQANGSTYSTVTVTYDSEKGWAVEVNDPVAATG